MLCLFAQLPFPLAAHRFVSEAVVNFYAFHDELDEVARGAVVCSLPPCPGTSIATMSSAK
jgi:hypothetical protein